MINYLAFSINYQYLRHVVLVVLYTQLLTSARERLQIIGDATTKETDITNGSVNYIINMVYTGA